MAWSELRLYGDPFADTPRARDLRELLARLADLCSGNASRNGWPESVMAPFLNLLPARDTITFVHPGSDDPGFGTDLAVRAFAALPEDLRAQLLIVLPMRDLALEQR